MKKKVKAMAKDALTLGIAGVGLGVMGGVSSSVAPSLGVLSKGVGTVGILVMVKHGVDILQDAMPKKKKGNGGW